MEKRINNVNDLKDLLIEFEKTNGNLPIFIRDENCEIHIDVNIHTATSSGKNICMLDI